MTPIPLLAAAVLGLAASAAPAFAAVDSRTLHIQWKPDERVRSKARVVVTVDVVRLTAFSAGGSGDIKTGALIAPTFALSIAGSGDVDFSGAAALTKGAIAGSGTIRQRK
jgi:hypothetical protein